MIKRLHGALHDEENEARFRREAQIAARLEHENIARTLRIEKIDGELCIVQEFIEGVNLGKVMRQLGVRPLPIIVAVHVVSAVARALAYAHGFGRMGIVHRDVTPENVMLSFAGDVKLIDFGTARSAVDGRVTDTGVVVGRRSYVPPEAWEGEKVDQRADVFALGVVLWEVLTGRRAEEAPEPSLPDASALNPDVPLLLGQVVARAMAPAPEDRYQSADEVVAALAAFIPPEADPRRDLADLLGLCFNVPLQEQLLAEDIAEAKQFLGDRNVVPAPVSVTDSMFPPPAERPSTDEAAPTIELETLATTTAAISQPATSEATAATIEAPSTPAGAAVPTARPVAPTVPIPAAAKRRANPGPWLAAGMAAIVATSGIGLLRTHGRAARSRASAASTVVAPQPVVPTPPAPPVANPEWPVAPALAESPPGAIAAKPAAVAARVPTRATRPDPRNAPADRLLRQANDLWERGNTPGAYTWRARRWRPGPEHRRTCCSVRCSST